MDKRIYTLERINKYLSSFIVVGSIVNKFLFPKFNYKKKTKGSDLDIVLSPNKRSNIKKSIKNEFFVIQICKEKQGYFFKLVDKKNFLKIDLFSPEIKEKINFLKLDGKRYHIKTKEEILLQNARDLYRRTTQKIEVKKIQKELFLYLLKDKSLNQKILTNLWKRDKKLLKINLNLIKYFTCIQKNLKKAKIKENLKTNPKDYYQSLDSAWGIKKESPEIIKRILSKISE